MRTAILLVVVVALGCGADDRDAGPVRTDDPTTGDAGTSDASSVFDSGRVDGTFDAGEPDDASLDDAAGTPDAQLPDMSGEVTYGQPCPYSDPPPFAGTCDPVRQTGCSVADEFCGTVVRIGGPRATVTASCQPRSNNTLQEGEACVGLEEKCAVGLHCVSFLDECRQLCFLDDAAGCEVDERCSRPSDEWIGLGFCDSGCEL